MIYAKIKGNKRFTYVFIDASNIWEIQKSKGRFFDYEKLKKFIIKKIDSKNIKMFFYTAYPTKGTRNYCLDGKHKFYTYLNKGLGFVIRKKELKRIIVTTNNTQSIEEKGNMDVEITIDAINHLKEYRVAIMFTGDSDFLALVNYLRKKGKKVYMFSSEKNASRELKTGGNGYFDVLKIKEDIFGEKAKTRKKEIKKQPSARKIVLGCNTLPVMTN